MLIRMRNATQAAPLTARALLLWLSVSLEIGVCRVNALPVKDYCEGLHPTVPPNTGFYFFLLADCARNRRQQKCEAARSYCGICICTPRLEIPLHLMVSARRRTIRPRRAPE